MNTVAEPVLYLTRIRHARKEPVRHEFEYRGYSWYFDVEHPPRLPLPLRPLAYFRARDHLHGPGADLRARLDDLLAQHDVDCVGGRITTLMNARMLGYVFDPLTLFWCHDDRDRLRCVIAEVHNTYGDRHSYVLFPDDLGRVTADKRLYVSPFNAVDGHYVLRVPEPDDALAIRIVLLRDHTAPFTASVSGHRVPVTARTVLRAQLRTPFSPWLIAARIRRHGLALWARGLPISPRPSVAHSPRRTAL
ncbi:DUF1365 domain-containing protein [Nocardia jejuensis]|uniref:DUF1365 domain-containing protein n=1 Tax=Nocardia jejuensis TaxID=328049 RepID=UPI00082EDECF|nr:DUF1365 domain-containing protein [Nocardia jejuensis]